MSAAAEVSVDLVETARAWLANNRGDITPQRVAEALRARGRPVGDATVLAVYEHLRRDIVGAGPLEDLLRRPGATDVVVNGPDQVFVDCGNGLEEAGVRFPDEAAVRRLAQRLAAGAGRRLDDASPYVDLRLADGTRFHAVLAPIARPGTVISLRLPATARRRLADLSCGPQPMLGAEAARLVEHLVGAKVAYLISGGTGSGKTTLLAAMLGSVPARERIVIVEDSSELRPDHPHVIGLEARPANIEGAGLIEVRTLVRQALRMRPDRLVVGEVRGAEVVDLLAALNTGHEGGCGTVHANSAASVPARIEALALAAGLNREAAHSQLASGVEAVLHVAVRRGARRLVEVAVPRIAASGMVEILTAVSFDANGARWGPGAAILEGRLAR